MAKKTKKIPELTPKQLEFLRLYWQLQRELKRAPSLAELGAAGGYVSSARASAQTMLGPLLRAGVVEMPEMRPVGGGVTDLGKAVLRRAKP